MFNLLLHSRQASEKTAVKQDESSTTTLALDHGSFFVPVAPWRRLPSPEALHGPCGESGPAATAIVWKRALQPGDACGGRGGVFANGT